MKILLDAMGGDNAPNAVLQGAAQAAQEFGQGMTIALLGPAETLKKAAAELSIDLAPFELIDCPEVITMEDDPVKAARQKKDSSMIRGLTMLKNGEADAFVSAGSTGALHVATSLIVRTLKGIKRPALAAQIPTLKQPFLLLDCGANAECRADMINTFGTMGSVYAQQIMGRATPAVALVNNGAEDHKGTPLYREAHERLKTNPSIHFAGNIEPRDLLKGEADVVVCDGFVGNVILKLTEGVAGALLSMLTRRCSARPNRLSRRTVPARPRASRTPSARRACALKTICAARCRKPSTRPSRPPRRQKPPPQRGTERRGKKIRN